MTTVEITLPSASSDDLRWERERELAEEAKRQGQLICWNFDFGLSDEGISLEDNAQFLSYTIALDHFAKTLFKDFEAQTARVKLYEGDLNFNKRMIWSEAFQEYLEEWLKELRATASPHYERLFAVNMFAEYLHRLSSYLPDSIEVCCVFEDTGRIEPAALAQILSKERFGHIKVQKETKASHGVILPRDEFLGEEALAKLNNMLTLLKIPFRIIPEALMTEEWHEIEVLFVLSSALSPTGKRMLQGFCAAGGLVVVEGAPIGLSEEISFDEWRKKESE